jgi:hypothetical protein
MTEPLPNEPPEPSPGRVRTWWHPLLSRTLDWALHDAYEVRDEVTVGRMPLRVDIVLSHHNDQLSDIAHRELSPLLPLLNERTLLEFKSPTDVLELGDLAHFLGCALLYHSQQRPPVVRGALTAIILAPVLTDAFREDAERLGLTLHQREAGKWELVGGHFPAWLVEADVLAQHPDTALALFSRAFLRDPVRIIEYWRDTGHTGILEFVFQQIEQFRGMGEAFAMQHKDVPVMDQTWEALQARVLATVPVEKRLEGLSPEERLEGLSPEERLDGLSAEERLEGLSVEELEQLRRLLDQRAAGRDNGNDNPSRSNDANQ